MFVGCTVLMLNYSSMGLKACLVLSSKITFFPRHWEGQLHVLCRKLAVIFAKRTPDFAAQDKVYIEQCCICADSGLVLLHLLVYISPSLCHGLISFNKPGTGQITSPLIIISGSLCDLRKTSIFPYNHTNKTTYFLKHQGQKHLKLGLGAHLEIYQIFQV